MRLKSAHLPPLQRAFALAFCLERSSPYTSPSLLFSFYANVNFSTKASLAILSKTVILQEPSYSPFPILIFSLALVTI